MSCTSCKTAFDWNSKSRKVKTGVIHNPHYFEWLRKNGENTRNIGDIQCGREIDHFFFLNFRGIKNNEITEDCRRIIHIRHVDIPYLREPVDTSTLRENYLMNKFDENHFKKMILMKKKKQELNNEILQVLDMYVNASTDILYRFREAYSLTKINWKYSEMYKELKELKKYKDTCLDEISEVYKTNITKDYKE